MKKLMYLTVIVLISSLILTGCSVLSNISQVPATGQSGITSLTKGDFDVECPAAPAVAGLLLEAAGVDNRYGTGKDGGNYIADVAHEMGPETDFHGIDKCDIEAYRLEIAKYLFDEGDGVTELFAVLESVVYEGMCNTFGTNAGETMTFTFSNDVVLSPEIIPHPTPIVYFDGGIPAIGTGPLTWTADGNEVVITTTGEFNTPRPDVGDIVTNLAGIVEVFNGLPVIVPVGGVVIEGIVTYDLVGDWMMDLFVGATLNERFIIIETFVSGEVTGLCGVGYDSTGAPTGDITGTVVGQSINMLYDRADYGSNYTATFEGTIEDCDYISGTWSDYARTDEPWVMHRTYY